MGAREKAREKGGEGGGRGERERESVRREHERATLARQLREFIQGLVQLVIIE